MYVYVFSHNCQLKYNFCLQRMNYNKYKCSNIHFLYKTTL